MHLKWDYHYNKWRNYQYKKNKPAEVAASSSSGYQPPPPPPGPPSLRRARTRSRSALPHPVEQIEQVLPRQDRLRSAKQDPIAIPINTPVQSREVSLASTADYRSRSSKRDQSIPQEDKRSRSRNGPEFALPIKEKSSEPRGRSIKTKSQEIMDQMMKSQDTTLMKVNVKRHLGKFAHAFAKQVKEPPKSTQTRALSEPVKTKLNI